MLQAASTPSPQPTPSHYWRSGGWSGHKDLFVGDVTTKLYAGDVRETRVIFCKNAGLKPTPVGLPWIPQTPEEDWKRRNVRLCICVNIKPMVPRIGWVLDVVSLPDETRLCPHSGHWGFQHNPSIPLDEMVQTVRLFTKLPAYLSSSIYDCWMAMREEATDPPHQEQIERTAFLFGGKDLLAAAKQEILETPLSPAQTQEIIDRAKSFGATFGTISPGSRQHLTL